MIKWIISGCLLGLAILFVCLKSVWTGFLYLSLAFLCALCLFWVYIRIKIYIRDYHTNFDKAFVNYKADVLNNTNATAEEFEKDLPLHYKRFKKLLRREKAVDIFKILFILTLAITCIVVDI